MIHTAGQPAGSESPAIRLGTRMIRTGRFPPESLASSRVNSKFSHRDGRGSAATAARQRRIKARRLAGPALMVAAAASGSAPG